MISLMEEKHWPSVQEIYQAGIDTGHATSDRCVYAGVAENSVYVEALHKALGFQPVGTRRRLGKMSYGPLAGQWRDVLALERRSTRAGIN